MLESWDGWGHDYNVTRSILQHGLSVDAKLNSKSLHDEQCADIRKLGKHITYLIYYRPTFLVNLVYKYY